MHDLEDEVKNARNILFALDYDGTLTPTIDDPTQAVLCGPTREMLAALAARKDMDVAVVSGRALRNVREMVGLADPIYVGNHGMEIQGPAFLFLEPTAAAAADDLHELGLDLTETLANFPGAFLEDKGLTLSIHHRRVAPVDAEEVWHTVLRAVEPVKDRFHVVLGIKAYDVRPIVSWTKGHAVNWIKDRLTKPETLVIYAGDDASDEEAIAVLGADAVTIRVGDSAATTSARYLLSSPAEVQGFLRWLHELVQQKPTAA
jgi:trehalose 6-phosphate phosphatase